MWGISFSPSSDGILCPRSEFGTHIPDAIFYIELLQQLDVLLLGQVKLSGIHW